jgi:hypothetical protein
MISTSLTNIDNYVPDMFDLDETNKIPNILDGNMKLTNALKESFAYIKNEELPKIKKLTKRKSSATSSTAELLRDQQNNSTEKI